MRSIGQNGRENASLHDTLVFEFKRQACLFQIICPGNMDSQDISFSDVVPHQYEDDEEPFQYASQHSNLDMPEDNEVADENEFIDENVTLDAEENESPSKRSRKYKSEVKKVVSKWLLFSGEQRPKVMKEFPHFQFADIAGEVASRYRNISPEDSERLDAIVALDKERYKQELAEAVDDAPRSKASTSGGASELPTSTLAFPLVRAVLNMCCKAYGVCARKRFIFCGC